MTDTRPTFEEWCSEMSRWLQASYQADRDLAAVTRTGLQTLIAWLRGDP